jgi:hypothetical protein
MSPTNPEMQRRVQRLVETFQIDHGVALPESPRGLSGRVLRSLLQMQQPNGDGQPRDSFLVPCDTKNERERGSISSSMSHAIRLCKKRFPDRGFTTRTVEGGIRCWRIA